MMQSESGMEASGTQMEGWRNNLVINQEVNLT